MVVQDVHTGLGPFGVDTILFSEPEHGEVLDNYLERVEKSDPSNTSYIAYGGFELYFSVLFPNSKVITFTQEFGTMPGIKVLKTLIEENYYYHYKDIDCSHWSKVNVLRSFYPDSDDWRRNIIERGESAFFQCLNLIRDNIAKNS